MTLWLLEREHEMEHRELEPLARRSVAIATFEDGGMLSRVDEVVTEEPLELRLAFGPDEGRISTSLSVTMRTPQATQRAGDDAHTEDEELAVGLLVAEGIIRDQKALRAIETCGPPPPSGKPSNVLRIELSPSCEVDLARLKRSFVSSASCGLCGKAGLEALSTAELQPLGPSNEDEQPWPEALLRALPTCLRSAQRTFARTGGLHGAGLFDARGRLIRCREDIGRHNAVDKVVGASVFAGELPLMGRLLLVSGRVSFEIVQKAVAAGVPVLAAIGAPSSLAVDLAERFGLTLVGFLQATRFNVYSHPERVVAAKRLVALPSVPAGDS